LEEKEGQLKKNKGPKRKRETKKEY